MGWKDWVIPTEFLSCSRCSYPPAFLCGKKGEIGRSARGPTDEPVLCQGRGKDAMAFVVPALAGLFRLKAGLRTHQSMLDSIRPLCVENRGNGAWGSGTSRLPKSRCCPNAGLVRQTGRSVVLASGADSDGRLSLADAFLRHVLFARVCAPCLMHGKESLLSAIGEFVWPREKTPNPGGPCLGQPSSAGRHANGGMRLAMVTHGE
jgi:hypothetical protein